MAYTPTPRDPKAPAIHINLLSDTQTRPTPAMREAMARAEVGDEQIGDDPSVNVLCERVAEL
ncbi:MAG TPA: beta-eliminating lyase-related protein, partial [Candidatus Sulfopaludibacter sp.]|nr:beta-eliminating lyase-related protein [Candidatus Sulfopaludibacter sp.]